MASSWREPAPSSALKEERCKQCRKLLGTGEIKSGHLNVACPRCGAMNRLPNR